MADFSEFKFDNTTLTVKDATARSGLAGKQDTLTAGTGISIVSNVISATGGGSGTWTSAVSKAVGSTSVTISDSSISTTSVVEDFAETSSGKKVYVNSIVVTNGQAVLSFDALEEATSFKLRITN